MTKLTEKKERFCLEYHATGNRSEAYRRAYNATNMTEESINVAACRLAQEANITLRLDALKAETQERCQISIDIQIAKLQKAYEQALADKQYAPAISAVMGQSKLAGLLSEKVTHSGVIDATPQMDSISIARRIAFLLRKGFDEMDSQAVKLEGGAR